MEDKIKLYVGDSGREKTFIDGQEIVTGRTCVIAQSGAGKSWTIAVLCEKLLENNIGFCIVDTDGEYFSLKQKYQVLWLGKANSDLNIETADLQDLCKKAVKENVPIIFDVSDVLDERKAVAELASSLYSVASELRLPYLLIIEEADKFVPQSKASMEALEEISKRGRKRGLGILIATQRPSLVNKNVLSQCGNQFIGKLTTENDLKAVDLFFPNRRELEELPKLSPGEFFVFGNILREKKKVKITRRETQHKGLTPRLIPKPAGKISELLEEISSAPLQLEEKTKWGMSKKDFNAVSPRFTREKMLEIVEGKRKKKFLFFGQKENVTSINLVYHPLAFAEVKMLEGFIRKSYNLYSFFVDGDSGKLVDIEDGLRFSEGFLLGLDEKDTKILFALIKAKRANITELELQTKFSGSTSRASLKKLEKLNLVTHSEEKRTNFYSPLHRISIPNLNRRSELPKLEAKASADYKITKEDVRNALKAINPNSDVTHFEVFYYPIWKARIGSRELNFDGMTGKEILL